MKDSPAAHAGDSVEADQLLKAIGALELETDALGKKLEPLDKPGAMLPHKDLSHLREGLKRIAARVGVCTALVDRIVEEPEKEVEPEIKDGPEPKPVVSPEDKILPVEEYSDNLTGLPSQLIAAKAIKAALESGRPRYAVVFCLDRISHMSNRYGADVGNQAIQHCALFLNQRLPADSMTFRWRGAAFLVLFDCSGTASEAKVLMEQISKQKQKFNFMTNHRSAMVNLSVSFLTIPLADIATPKDIDRIVDLFVVAHSNRQPH